LKNIKKIQNSTKRKEREKKKIKQDRKGGKQIQVIIL
jgi:hypothetical protein